MRPGVRCVLWLEQRTWAKPSVFAQGSLTLSASSESGYLMEIQPSFGGFSSFERLGNPRLESDLKGCNHHLNVFFLPSSTIKHIMINNAVLVDDYFKNYIPMGIPLISTYGNPIPNLCNAVRGRFWTLLILTSVFARQACVLLSWHDMEIQCSFPENDLQTVVKLFLPYHVNGQELFGVVHLSSR